MTAAVELQKAIGKKNIEARVRYLSTRLRTGLKDDSRRQAVDVRRPGVRGGADAVQCPRHPDGERAEGDPVTRDRIYIRTMTTGNLNACRAATHIYNMPDEVDRLIASVRHVSENATRYMTTAAQ